MMQRAILSLLTLTFALPATAQLEYVKAPISIENAMLTHPGEPVGVPVSVPVSEAIDLSGATGCVQNSPILEVAVVQNVLEVTYSGGAIAGGGQLCGATAYLHFDVVLEVPVVSYDPAAFVYLVGESSGTFTELRAASLRFTTLSTWPALRK